MPAITSKDLENSEKTRLSEIIFNKKKLEILSHLLEKKEEKLTISEINENVEGSRPFVSEFINDLQNLGILDKQRKGNLFLIQINEKSPYLDPLTQLLEIDSKPLRKAAKELSENLMNSNSEISNFIHSIYLFGSIARGNPGLDSDIDLLIVTEGRDSQGKLKNEIEGEIWSNAKELNLNFSPTFYDKEEFRNDLSQDIAFANKIREDGILLEGEDIF